MSVHWYRVEIQAGMETYCYFGQTALTEQEMVEALNRDEFVQLNDITYFDDGGEPRRWTDWDPHFQPRILLNPKFVVSILPLVDDPKKPSDGGEGSKLLQYPNSRPPSGPEA